MLTRILTTATISIALLTAGPAMAAEPPTGLVTIGLAIPDNNGNSDAVDFDNGLDITVEWSPNNLSHSINPYFGYQNASASLAFGNDRRDEDVDAFKAGVSIPLATTTIKLRVGATYNITDTTIRFGGVTTNDTDRDYGVDLGFVAGLPGSRLAFMGSYNTKPEILGLGLGLTF